MAKDTGRNVGTVAGGAIGSYYGPAGTMIGSAAGGLIGGMFDGNQNPDAPGKVPLDPGAQALVDRGINRSERPVDQYAAENAKNAEAYGEGLSGGNAEQRAAQTGSNPYFAKAAQQLYQQKAAKGYSDINKENHLNAFIQRGHEMNQQAQVLLGQQQAMNQQQAFLANVYAQQEQERAQMINSIFGLANRGIGSYFGNRNTSMARQSNPQASPSLFDQTRGQTGGYSNDITSAGMNPNFE